jgi:hypothetical protein
MENDIWTVQDINNKVQNIIRSKYSSDDEWKAARLARKSNATIEEQQFIAGVDSVIESAILEGKQAQTDMTLLLETITIETADRRLKQEQVQPEFDENENIINQNAIDLDDAERNAAQAVIDNASDTAKDLFLQRNPISND